MQSPVNLIPGKLSIQLLHLNAKVSYWIIWFVYCEKMHFSTQRKLYCSVKVLKGHLVWIEFTYFYQALVRLH